MPRLFVGIALPESIRERLFLMQGGVPGARWEEQDKLHVTITFIGETDHGTMRGIEDGLVAVQWTSFDLQLRGIGFFPPRGKPRSLWVGIADPSPLLPLKAKVDRILSDLGIEPDPRRFTPHVTLARLRDAPRDKVMQFIGDHSLFQTEPFSVASFKLFSSVRSPKGSRYRVEAAFPLADTLG